MAVAITYASVMPIKPIEMYINSEPQIIQTISSPAGPAQLKQTPEQIVIDTFGKSSLMYNISRCESGFNPSAVGDTNLTCKATGLPMRSRGLWQINSCGHPEVSDEQAFDPEWSTQWALKQYKKGNAQKEWKNCYNQNVHQSL